MRLSVPSPPIRANSLLFNFTTQPSRNPPGMELLPSCQTFSSLIMYSYVLDSKPPKHIDCIWHCDGCSIISLLVQIAVWNPVLKVFV